MSQIPGPPPRTELLPGREFYVTGGTLRPDAPSYVERQADKDLCEGLLNGEFCYVLTSRQMGKSSLMVRTVKRLREEGVAVAVLDLTAIGQNLSVEQWYDGLVSRLGQQLNLEDELFDFWQTHPEWGPLQRWTSALEQVVLKKITSEVVIFVDEIDIVRSLPFSTDEFFAAIRECYNRRAHEPAFNRLAIGLLGVATPTDLIRDTRMTPFNIGRRIELNDFTPQEALPLAGGLSADETSARELLLRVLHWTGGHPYLTQRLCRGLAESLYAPGPLDAPPVLPNPRDVDKLAEKLFLSRQARDRDDNLIFVRERVLRSETDVAGLLLLYRKIYLGELVPDAETNPLVSILHLSGIARGVNGYLQVRNRIYRQVFDLGWIQANMPDPEVRRQRKASRRGLLLGLSIAAVLILSYLFIVPMWKEYREERLAHETVQGIQKLYSNLASYQDVFESHVELALTDQTLQVPGSGSINFEKPDRVTLSLKSGFNSPETELRFIRSGPFSLVYLPSKNEYQSMVPPPPSVAVAVPSQVNRHLGPVMLLPLYHLLLEQSVVQNLAREARNIQPAGYAELEGQRVRVVRWELDSRFLLPRPGMRIGHRSGRIVELAVPPDAAESVSLPVTAWVNSSNVVMQLRVDFSNCAGQVSELPPEIPVMSLVITEMHRLVQLKHGRREQQPFIVPAPPEGAKEVERLELPPLNLPKLTGARREFDRLIPPRLPYVPSDLIDLSAYYNAAFAQTWHVGTENNNLQMLATGVLQLGGTAFDVRGIVQLGGRKLQGTGVRYPQQIKSIKIGQKCRLLHFLHGVGWSTKEGVPVGSYTVRFASGKEEKIPLIYGEDVRDWNMGGDPVTKLTRATVVWRAQNDAHFSVRLFKITWLNPDPNDEVSELDFNSTMTDAAPFVLAVTAEP